MCKTSNRVHLFVLFGIVLLALALRVYRLEVKQAERAASEASEGGWAGSAGPGPAMMQASLQLVGTRLMSSRPLRAVAIDDATDTVAAAGDDGVIRTVAIDAMTVGNLREMPCGEGGIWSLAFSGDGRIIAGCGDGSLRVCFLEGGRIL